MEIKFKQVNYKGDGYMHIMENIKTGEQEYFPCEEETYTKMSGVDGQEFNPIMKGYKHISSHKGTILTDSENSCLNPMEYCENGEDIFLTIRNKEGKISQVSLYKNDIK